MAATLTASTSEEDAAETPWPIPSTHHPPHPNHLLLLLLFLVGILIRHQLTRLSTVSCSAPHQKLLVCVKRCNLHSWYFPRLPRGDAPRASPTPSAGCSSPSGLLNEELGAPERWDASLLKFFCLLPLLSVAVVPKQLYNSTEWWSPTSYNGNIWPGFFIALVW